MRKRTAFICNILITTLGLAAGLAAQGQTARIKDLVNIRGNRSNSLIGFGLVVGLASTGDSKKSIVTNQATASLITKLGIQTNDQSVLTQSIAAVVVTAELPAFGRNGDRVPVKVAIVGDAKSLSGGTLLPTQLRAGDGQIYAVAQGSIITGKTAGDSITAAVIPNAATIEKSFKPQLIINGKIDLTLKNPDFSTNNAIADKINERFKGFYAQSQDSSLIQIEIPNQFLDRTIEFIAEMEKIEVPVNNRAIVVLNERTGTVVMGEHVTLGKVVVNHGDLSIQVGDDKKNTTSESVVTLGGSTVGDLIKSLNALGVKPHDLVAILQAIHASGALPAELKFL